MIGVWCGPRVRFARSPGDGIYVIIDAIITFFIMTDPKPTTNTPNPSSTRKKSKGFVGVVHPDSIRLLEIDHAREREGLRRRQEQEKLSMQYLVLRESMISRLKSVFEKVQSHPDFVCDQPGRKALRLTLEFDNEKGQTKDILLINRMNSKFELVQEIEVGHVDGDPERESLLVCLQNDQFSVSPASTFIQTHIQTHAELVEKSIVHALVKHTNFLDVLEKTEKALDASMAKPLFETIPTERNV